MPMKQFALHLLELTPKMVEPFLSRDELKLYTLIWNRFMASQMAPQQNESTTIELNVNDDLYI